MIHLVNAVRHRVKEFPKKKIFLRPTTVSIPTSERTAILVRNNLEATALIRLFTGQLRLSEGRIECKGTISPPIGKMGNIPVSLTPFQAVQFASRLYDVENNVMMASIMLLTGIEEYIDVPLKHVPPECRNRFNHALWLTIRFNCYIFQQRLTLSGQPDYNKKLGLFLKGAFLNAGLILFTSTPKFALQSCDHGLVFSDCTLTPFDDIEKAIEFFES